MKNSGLIRKAATVSAWMLLLAMPGSSHDGNHGLVFLSKLDSQQEVPKVSLEGNPQGLVGMKLNETCDTLRLFAAFQDLSSAIAKFHIHQGPRGVAGPALLDLIGTVKDNAAAANWTGFTGKDVRQMLRGAYYLNVHTSANPAGEVRGQIEPERDALFSADLGGANEVPANQAKGTGVAFFSLSPDDSILTVKARVQGLTDTITAAHIHQGPAGVNGSVVLDLKPGLVGEEIEGVLRVAALAAPGAFLDSLRKGSLYVNVHTKANPAGEIRGQIRAEKGVAFTAALKGTNEVPAVTTPATGLAFFRLSDDDSSLTVNVVFGGLKDSLTAAHLHKAPAGSNGGVVVNLATSVSGNSIAGTVKISSVTDGKTFLDDLVKGNIYVNIHSKAHAGGELRGQLVLPVRTGFAFALSGSQEVPAADTWGRGVAVATMNPHGTDIKYAALVDGLGSAFKLAHFHKAAVGANGGVVQNLTPAFKDNRASGVWTSRDAAPLTAELAEAFHAGGLYLNVHTEKLANGELRGQADDLPLDKTVVVGIAPGKAVRGSSWPELKVDAQALTLRFEGRPGEVLEVSFADATGKVRMRRKVSVGPGALSEAVDLKGLETGLYLVRWNAGGAVRHAAVVRP